MQYCIRIYIHVGNVDVSTVLEYLNTKFGVFKDTAQVIRETIRNIRIMS